LWINLVTDGLPALALAYERAEANLMRRPPRPRDESIFSGGVGRDITLFAALIALVCLALYAHLYYFGPGGADFTRDNEPYARTAVFVALAYCQLFYVLGLRSSDRSLLASSPLANWRLSIAILVAALLQLAVVYVPFLQSIFHTVALEGRHLALAVGGSLFVLLVFESTKQWRRASATR
jgi:Ca2+-transporting ATPase